MNPKFFDINQRYSVEPRRVGRAIESWSMNPVDFLDETIAMAGSGQRLDVGVWYMFGGVRVGAVDRLGMGLEAGWHRWVLPSEDGAVHKQRDWSAPWVTRSPTGALFWCRGKRQELVNFAAMLARCSAHLERVGVQ